MKRGTTKHATPARDVKLVVLYISFRERSDGWMEKGSRGARGNLNTLHTFSYYITILGKKLVLVKLFALLSKIPVVCSRVRKEQCISTSDIARIQRYRHTIQYCRASTINMHTIQ